VPLRLRLRHYAGLLTILAIALGVFAAVTRHSAISTTGLSPFSLADADLSTISPKIPVDYLAVVRSFDGVAYEVVAEHGTKCATATNESSCLVEIREILTSSDAVTTRRCGSCVGLTLVASRGNEVFDVADLPEFLGTIESSTEAAMVVSVASWVRQLENGYEVIKSHYTDECNPIVEVSTLSHVVADGAITTLDSHTTRRPGICL